MIAVSAERATYHRHTSPHRRPPYSGASLGERTRNYPTLLGAEPLLVPTPFLDDNLLPAVLTCRDLFRHVLLGIHLSPALGRAVALALLSHKRLQADATLDLGTSWRTPLGCPGFTRTFPRAVEGFKGSSFVYLVKHKARSTLLSHSVVRLVSASLYSSHSYILFEIERYVNGRCYCA